MWNADESNGAFRIRTFQHSHTPQRQITTKSKCASTSINLGIKQIFDELGNGRHLKSCCCGDLILSVCKQQFSRRWRARRPKYQLVDHRQQLKTIDNWHANTSDARDCMG